MLACCLRAVSNNARVVSTHPRALYSTPAYVDVTRAKLDTMINSIEHPDSGPPTGTDYPKAKRNIPTDDKILAQWYPPIHYSLYCQSTRNNTITTLMDNKFHHIASFSGGLCGFKKVNRSSYEAGYQCAVRMFRQIEKVAAQQSQQSFVIDLYFKGFGQGRDAMHKALLTSEGDRVRPLVATITDRTPIKIGGTRAKKARRL